ncbi:ATP-binding protein [Actinomadura rudentiformis]|uniref:ATP-binding protein n=1 Tax=Actinomadura rudentiformis TaxID=359158 RepID=UPI001CEF5ACF|nr:LuxR C-terminal-related transcriptional regulator [Actinomadura rudentiformis]
MTSFVGRRREIADVRQMLTRSRMVTLTGPGGVGKTRLASRVAADVQRAFPDGVWLVELAALQNPELLVQTVIDTLEIQDRTSRSPIRVLVDHLQGRRALLILDNCEHLLGETAMLAGELLRAAPDLRILATSRQALGIVGEQTMGVPPMPLPDSGRQDPADVLAGADAVQLFTDRAVAVLPGFTLNDANRGVVERIVRRLDGIPLGIELAAVRLRVLSIEQLNDRLDDRFRLLSAGSRTVMPRHQTLRALIDWSHTLCTEQERLLWARASVFADGLDLDAAEAVCAGDGIDRDEIIDLVAGLVDKSVFTREEQAGGVRYRLLETIRQYGLDRLRESGDEDRLRGRHRDYYRDLAVHAQEEWFGPDQVTWFERLRSEHGNLRTALDFCFATPGEHAQALIMTTALRYYWIAAGFLREGRTWVERGLASSQAAPDDVRALALCMLTRLAILQNDFAAAESGLKESRVLAERLGDGSIIAQVRYVSGLAALFQGRLPEALKLLAEATYDWYGEIGDEMGVVNSMMYLAIAHSFLGDSDTAVTLFEECLRRCEARSENWFTSYAKCVYGLEVWRQGDPARAIELEHESIRLKEPFNDGLGTALCVEILAWIAAGEDDCERAALLLGALGPMWRSVGGSLFHYLRAFHEDCERRARDGLGARKFDSIMAKGAGLDLRQAVAVALGEKAPVDETSGTAVAESPLTPRELETARLVAQGLTNKEIAAALVISRRTAEGHIEHIMNKLGFKSRTQIAVYIGQLDRALDGDGASTGEV